MANVERQVEKSMLKVYPWSMSATGYFHRDQLVVLQYHDVGKLVQLLDQEPHMLIISVMEIIGHGNIRRAVQIARGLVEVNPRHEQRFRQYMDQDTMRYWFSEPLEKIPSNPSEIPVPIEYVYVH